MTTYPLASASWDDAEIAAIQDVLATGRFTMGDRVREFESAFSEFVGARYAVMVNSGSSANLLGIAAVCHLEAGLSAGDEVIVPAVSWATTYFPVTQYGLQLRFVDVDLNTLNIDVEQVAAAVTPKTRAILAVNLLGAPNDFTALRQICEDHGLLLLEDNCESLGATYRGQQTGTIGVVGTFSFFFSHHMSTMEGGMIVTDDLAIAERLISLRAHGWTRELPPVNTIHPKTGNEFEDLFRFVLPGYNVRPLEIEAAAGLVQLGKLPRMLEQRRTNAQLFVDLFSTRDDVITQQPVSGADSSWFGFSLVLDGALRGQRARVAASLSRAGIESRPIVAGDFTRNPVCALLPHDVVGQLDAARRVDVDGLFVGNHHYPLADELRHLATTLDAIHSECQ